jgi:DNA (cytosine-5)-methyltransferase 1
MGRTFKGLSLFSSAGIAEFGFKNTNIDILLSNELLRKRTDVHKFWHPHVQTIDGDITSPLVKSKIIKRSKELDIDFVFATPPCQGVSLIGKNKSNEQMLTDERNYLIFSVIDIIKKLKPKVILIENVSRFLKIKYWIDSEFKTIEEILNKEFGKKYNINCGLYNARKYGIPQNRERAIIKMWLKSENIKWNEPIEQKEITLKEAIGYLPSLESGEKSQIKNHYARSHTKDHITFMRHTPTGKSAFENKVHYPINHKTGKRLKGYAATYKRMSWDKPAPTITMRNDCISSQSNVHPGRKISEDCYSDARVLTLRELFILSSMNPDLDIPEFVSDSQIRYMIGEAVPPRLINEIVKGLKWDE